MTRGRTTALLLGAAILTVVLYVILLEISVAPDWVFTVLAGAVLGVISMRLVNRDP